MDAPKIIESLRTHKLVDGLTHNLYSYPARFSPELAKEIIKNFSNSADWIFDPFMGGGTSVVEALAMGRRALGVDINSLAWFVAVGKTTPLSTTSIVELRNWPSRIGRAQPQGHPSLRIDELSRHFPKPFLAFLDELVQSTNVFEAENTKRIARLVLLNVYQSALTDRYHYPSPDALRQKLIVGLDKVMSGLESFLDACKYSGHTRRSIASGKKLLNRSTIGIETDHSIREFMGQPRLVLTSPPYPGVHVLYNKWQIAGRKETRLPYYISGMNDSQPESYYTLGGRSSTGVARYFELITQSFLSISKVVHRKAVIAQLVGFSKSRTQLPMYLRAMEEAGYKEIFPVSAEGKRPWRDVPNRKWYANIRDQWDSSREVLLFHVLGRGQ